MSIKQEIIPTQPAMPAAIKKNHKPTLIFKMPIEKAEDEREECRKATRYSFIDYTYKSKKRAG